MEISQLVFRGLDSETVNRVRQMSCGNLASSTFDDRWNLIENLAEESYYEEMNNSYAYNFSLGLHFECEIWVPHVSFDCFRRYSYDNYMEPLYVAPPAPQEHSYEHDFVPPSPYDIPSVSYDVGCQGDYFDHSFDQTDPSFACSPSPPEPSTNELQDLNNWLSNQLVEQQQLLNQMMKQQLEINEMWKGNVEFGAQIQTNLEVSLKTNECESSLAPIPFERPFEVCHSVGCGIVEQSSKDMGVFIDDEFESCPPSLPVLSSPPPTLTCDTLGNDGVVLSSETIEPLEALSCVESEHVGDSLGVETSAPLPCVRFSRKPDLIPSAPLSCFPLFLRPLDFDLPSPKVELEPSLPSFSFSLPPCVFSPFVFSFYVPSFSFRFVYISLYFLFAFSFFLFILVYSVLLEFVASKFDKLLRSLSNYFLATVKLKTLNKRFSGGNPSF